MRGGGIDNARRPLPQACGHGGTLARRDIGQAEDEHIHLGHQGALGGLVIGQRTQRDMRQSGETLADL